MLPNSLQTLVIGIFVLTATITSTTASPTETVNIQPQQPQQQHSGTETTTSSLPLPLQPPPNLTSTTTSSFLKEHDQEQHSLTTDNIAVNADNPSINVSSNNNHDDGGDNNDEDDNYSNNHSLSVQQERSKKRALYNGYSVYNNYPFKQPENGVLSVPGVFEVGRMTDLNAYGQGPVSEYKATEDYQTESTVNPRYIHFELTDVTTEEILQKRKAKADTVNEVLSNLFPNGFSDIFRFSYASEPSTTTPASPQIVITTTPVSPEIITTTTPSTVSPTTTNAKESSTRKLKPAKNQTYYRFETSISAEYRREIRPGHTEIVVEKLAKMPRAHSGEFVDGSNAITRNKLLRINRAAVDAPVLPSLLLEPDPDSSNATEPRHENRVPIVILNENSAEIEGTSEEDNLIAESQNVGHHYFQRLPAPDKAYPTYKTDDNNDYKLVQVPQINVHILQHQMPEPAQQQLPGPLVGNLFTPNINTKGSAANQSPDPLDHFHEHAEKSFHQRDLEQEAPSRQFLKHFNPLLSQGEGGPIQKGNFHYEQNTQSSDAADSSEEYAKPSAQLQYLQYQQQQQQQQQNELQTVPSETPSVEWNTQLHHPEANIPRDYQGYQHSGTTHDQPVPARDLVFVTVNPPSATPQTISGKTPHEFVSEAAAAASQFLSHRVPDPQLKPKGGYTYVEVQKSVNIHNKLITEKDGQLIEQHETIYPQTQYEQGLPNEPHQERQEAPQHAQETEFQGPTNYVSLSANPINVQHIESESERQEEAASQDTVQHIAPQPQEQHPSTAGVERQQHINYVESIVHQPYPVAVPQPYPVPVAQPYPVTQIVEKTVPEPYPVKEIVEKIVDRPVAVEKIVDHPFEVPYTVTVDHYIDRPYPVHEIVEKQVPLPYPVPEPVPVAVHYDHYIDRPYPVETIVEKPMPYPVEKVVEKVVEKHVPVEVERIVEKPVEKVVEKYVDRPIAIPIHVPVAVPVHMSHLPGQHSHPNSLGWTQAPFGVSNIPPKVLQNYYARMLKKLLPQMAIPNNLPTTPVPSKKPKASVKPAKSSQAPHKLKYNWDILFDLKPPPPPLGPNWLKGSRYIYNTLPQDLTSPAVAAADQQTSSYQAPEYGANYHIDEFQRWRNGHNLKRSPSFGRNLQMEYGFKPPLVPSLEIDEKGMPLKSAHEQ